MSQAEVTTGPSAPPPPGTPAPAEATPAEGAPAEGATSPTPVPSPAPDVLELRIHGISNTPPATMLDLPPEEVTRSLGDDLGSFWVPTDKAAARDRALPAGQRHALRSDVRREAYSWGAMARLAGFPGSGLLGTLGRAVVRAFWVIAVPFGLVNVAYWARRLRGPQGARTRAGTGPIAVFSLSLTLLVVASAATVALDLLGTQCIGPRVPLAPADAGSDARGHVALVCTQLPEMLHGLARLDTGPRLALLSIVPVLVAALAAAVSAGGKVRFEDRLSVARAAQPTDGGRASAALTPELAVDGFWSRRPAGTRTLLAHLAGALTFVAALLTWNALFGAVPGCVDLASFATRACWDTVWRPGSSATLFLVLLVVALVLLVAVGVLLVRTALAAEDHRGERAPSGVVVWGVTLACLAVYVASAVAVATRTPAPEPGVPVEQGARFAGLVVAPGILVVVLLAIAIAGLGWRGGASSRWLWWAGAGGGLLVVQMLWGRGPGEGTASAYAWVGALACTAVLVARVVVALVRAPRGRDEGWRGGGPGVFLLLSAASAMVFSSLVVMGTLAYLRRGVDAAAFTLTDELTGLVPPRDAARDWVVVDRMLDDPLVAPSAYAEFGAGAAALLALLLLLVLVLLGPVVRDALRRDRPRMPGAPGTTVDPHAPGAQEVLDATRRLSAAASDDGASHHGAAEGAATGPDTGAAPGAHGGPEAGGGAEPDATSDRVVPPAADRVLRARHVAALAQRAEIVVGLLAGSAAVVLGLTIVAEPPGTGVGRAPGTDSLWELPEWLVSWTVPAVGILALALTASMVAGAAQGLARPWGLLWDLMCFLPRAAHPFGPPCYADRVVPEVRARVESWLAAEDVADPQERATTAPRRTVVLSAHSLGAVIATAVVLARQPLGPDGMARLDRRVGLVTYGTQLRAYFGRFFPELLGPVATGTPACTAPRVRAGDPWGREVEHPQPLRPAAGTLVDRLPMTSDGTPAWANVWRRTDPIGMPVVGYGDNPVDRGAEEVDRTQYLFAIAGHSGYERSWAYHRALDDVVERMRAAHPGGRRAARQSGERPAATVAADRGGPGPLGESSGEPAGPPP